MRIGQPQSSLVVDDIVENCVRINRINDNADVWPFDATECYDRDYDGVGDNADAFPESALEWLDSDGDGLGDNADVFPFDKDAKYDTDGDGVPDSTDFFPRNSGMDSFVDLGWRIGLGLMVIGGILFMIQPDSIYIMTLRKSKFTQNSQARGQMLDD